jgi:phosphohistidine phosphatase
MRLLLVRHAIAADATTAPGGDALRPLTAEGRERFARGARALAELVPDLALVLTSPIVRARQTAEMLAAAYPEPPPVDALDALGPGGDSDAVLRALARLEAAPALALVGHEPGISALAGLLLTGQARSLTAFKKGGAALVDWLPGAPAGSALLFWHLTAGQLRGLAP